eukprot:COSAG06_NODE_1864_length_8194_cov_4.258431_11_plen_82_part_01
MNRSLVAVVGTWQDFLTQRQGLRRLVKRILNSQLMYAWEALVEIVVTRRQQKTEQEVIVRRALQRLANGCLVAAFEMFTEHR